MEESQPKLQPRANRILIHHCLPLDKFLSLKGPCIIPHPSHTAEEYYVHAFRWWEELFGFYPLFLSVGQGPETFKLTGYDRQFTRRYRCRWDPRKKRRIFDTYPAGQSPNYLLLSFEFSDFLQVRHYHRFDLWEHILGWSGNACIPKTLERQLVAHSQRKPTNWLRTAKKRDGYVQLCVPMLDLTLVRRIWVRNIKTQKIVRTHLQTHFPHINPIIARQRFSAPKWTF